VIGCEEGRSSQSWIDYNFFGHQLVCHWASNTVRAAARRGTAWRLTVQTVHAPQLHQFLARSVIHAFTTQTHPRASRLAHSHPAQYRGPKIYNSVDHDMVPVPHLGVCLSVPEFHATAERLKAAGIKWIMEPQVRFVGKPGEQWTMFFEDPSGNNVEIKAMVIPENLFARYFVDESPLPEKK
jgi:extradiol dioxygenase family protein